MTERTVLVTGATGQQGGATARALLTAGWHVRALVRDPGAPAARRLAEAGAEIVPGDMGDRDSLAEAVRGAHGVFSVQPAAGPPHGVAEEVRLGVNVADAAHAAGVRHLVYASVGGADRDSGISHWNTKWEIEQHIRALGVPATILRPVMFMENHARPHYGVTGDAALVRVIPPRATVQLIAVTDIGAFAALAFADPDRYVGKALELAGDELSRDALVAAIGRATGRPVDVEPIPAERRAALGLGAADMEAVDSFGGWRADIPALRALHPGLMDFETWLEREGKVQFDALFAAS
ncbi:NmrA/HSCARG family protein [Nonomuraea roseoviolacea subsp. roseoviolacea]|uniref:NmrA/HSCARG family protein n=1 Tax=Nonomuraea roseoviolacea TaxID=103837 RepID=UPI0031CF4306